MNANDSGSNTTKTRDSHFPWRVTVGIFTLLILSTGGAFAFFMYQWQKGRIDEQGQFGDSFGLLNAIFSGLAFGAVTVAVVIQTLELKAQREEMRQSLDAHHKQADNFAKQIEEQRKNAELEAAELRKRRTYELFERWNDLVESTSVVRGEFDHDYENAIPGIVVHRTPLVFSRVLSFYVTCARLLQHQGLIDQQLFESLLGRDVHRSISYYPTGEYLEELPNDIREDIVYLKGELDKFAVDSPK